jgi:hypothetical protein
MKRDPNAVARDRANAAAEADMTRTELAAIWPPTARAAREAGHKPMSPLKAIREWPFRAGKHPWWGEGEETGQILANSERQTAFQDEGLPPC